MYIERVPNRASRPTILLREGRREGHRVVKRTLANLSDWPDERVEALRRLLANERLVGVEELVTIERSVPHGHAEAILGTIRRIGLDSLIASKRSHERDLVLAMIAERLIAPASKLGTTRLWKTTTLGEELGVTDAEVDELYSALDWLLDRQERIERKLAHRHLREGARVLYDVSSSFYCGRHCTLARFGHDRDGKKGLPIIVYGMLTDEEGRPVAVGVYPGNTADPKTVPDQIRSLRDRFGLSRVTLVGDRGMLTDAQIEALRVHPGLSWISCLRSPAIRSLVEQKHLQMSLFDHTRLAELHVPEYPGERLIACYNPLLAEERARKREELLVMTERDLERIQRDIQRRTRTPLTKADIGVRVGRVLFHYKMGKHFALKIEDGALSWERRKDQIEAEATLDGLYVIRTSEPADQLSAEDAVRTYKSLAHVERVFRSLKGFGLRIRPIFHRAERRVRAHVFLCTLAYYVEWHMRRALAPLLFADEELPTLRRQRPPVDPAAPSISAQRKKASLVDDHGRPIHSFSTLLAELSSRCRVVCSLPGHSATFTQLTSPNPLQQQALELLALVPSSRKER
jgi:Transposase DDE domain